MADTTNAVPGQSGNFNGFGEPAVSGSNLAFTGVFNGFSASGIYTGVVGSTGASRVADPSTPVPGQSGNFEGFGDAALSGSTVAFRGSYSGGEGIYTGTVGTTGASRVADFSTAVPGQSGLNFTGLNARPALSGSTVAFRGEYSGGEGIYTGVVGSTGASRVADRTTAVPGQSGNFTFLNRPALSGSTVAFQGNYSGGQGIYTGTAGSTGAVLLADGSLAVPGQSGNFTGFGDSLSISGSNVAFVGSYSGGSGIYTGVAGTTGAARVADTSTPVPGQSGVNFGFFLNNAAISGDTVSFVGFYNGFSNSGLYLRLDGSLVDVIETGDPLFGSTVTDIGSGNFTLDGNTLAFTYTLANGVGGLAIATIVPEPGTYALALAGGAVGLIGAVRRQRRLGRRRA